MALYHMSRAIEVFSDLYTPYAHPSLTLIEATMGDGMEYDGMFFLSSNFFADYQQGIIANNLMVLTVHETAHQWWYARVGSDPYNEPWLDEAVTQYVTGQYFLDRYGEQSMQDYCCSWLSRWERVGQEPIPIGLPAGSYQGKEYGAIVYGRGPLFMEALAQQMGQVKFDQFLRDYYEAHQWGIGNAKAFKQLAENYCGCDLTDLFMEWVYPK